MHRTVFRLGQDDRVDSSGDGSGFGQGGSVTYTDNGDLQPDSAADVGRIASGVGMMGVKAVKKPINGPCHAKFCGGLAGIVGAGCSPGGDHGIAEDSVRPAGEYFNGLLGKR